jgi:hypothetical protein
MNFEQAIVEEIEHDVKTEAADLTARAARRGGTVRKAKDDALPALETAAQQAIAAVERLTLGQAFDGPVTAARVALDVAAQRAGADLSPGLVPVDAGALADFQLGLAAMPSTGALAPAMADFHQEALDAGRSELAVVIRTRGRKIVARRASETRSGNRDLAQAAEQKALRAFDGAVARQLHSRGLCEPASGFLVECLPALLSRFTAAEQRHVEHAAADVERQRHAATSEAEREKAEAEAAERAAWSATLRAEQTDPDQGALVRRRHLANVYRRYPTFIWRGLLGRNWTGEQAAAAIDAGAPFEPFYRAQGRGEQPQGHRS